MAKREGAEWSGSRVLLALLAKDPDIVTRTLAQAA